MCLIGWHICVYLAMATLVCAYVYVLNIESKKYIISLYDCYCSGQFLLGIRYVQLCCCCCCCPIKWSDGLTAILWPLLSEGPDYNICCICDCFRWSHCLNIAFSVIGLTSSRHFQYFWLVVHAIDHWRTAFTFFDYIASV